MKKPVNFMEIYKLLNGSNCKECNEKTCMAFAAAVSKNRRQIGECPHVDEEVVAQFGEPPQGEDTGEVENRRRVEELISRVKEVDLASVADRLGGRFEENKLKLKVMGKDFCVDTDGNLSSEIHVHDWITVPFLDYIVRGVGKTPRDKWLPFRELPNGKNWERFFNHRAEIPLKEVADRYTDLFRDMIYVFNGKQVDRLFDADISLVLHPLPKFPMLINYWEPEDGLGSSLNIFFDETAEENLSIDSIYYLGTGVVVMFQKVAQRHGVAV